MPLDLRVELLGRPVKPVALGLLVAMTALVATGIGGTGLLGGTHWGYTGAAIALAAALLFVGSWVARSQRVAEAAILLAFFTLAARSIFLFIVAGAAQPAGWLSASLAIIAGGSYWLERGDSIGRQGGR